MKKILRMFSTILMISLLANVSDATANENGFRDIFKDALYGGALGTLVGGALLAFTHKPAEHLDYLGYGASIGILTGTAYGLARSARALAEIDKGRVRIAMPVLVPDLVESQVTGGTSITWRANLIRGTF